jgi:rod shape determining protein RodA
MLNQRLLRNLDFVLIGAVLLLVVISLAVIGSATHINSPGESRYWYLERQGTSILINIILIFFILHFDYKSLEKFGWVLYGLNIVLLAAVMFIGHSALGAQRWIQIGPITLQPSEFSKIIMIIFLARLLDKNLNNLQSFKGLIPIFIYVGIPFLLVLKQPDMGTSLVFMAILFGMLFVAGISLKHLFGIIGAGVAFIPIFWHFVLKEYQKQRLLVFIDPNVDPLGSGYHIIQSKIAIGSGMIFGKGLFNGTQSQLNFLPENHTDFIFAVVGEELGFIGAVIILFLYLIILLRSIKIAEEARDNFGTLLAAGITSMLAFHILVNIGMTAGIMPVTGIPLPLMSYGVSSLTSNLISIGILLNIYMRRQKILF